jgi:CRP/FNR family transcriptional regulator, cyclic AMP receptor protein
MKTNLNRQHEEAFTLLRSNLSRLNLPPGLLDELIDRHIPIVFEKGALAFREGNTDSMLGCILSGYVKVYCPVGDGNRTLVRMAGPGDVIGYQDYVDEKGRKARMFEAQVARKCTLALFSRDHVTHLLAALPADCLLTIISAFNTFWSENLRFFTTLLNLPFWDRLTIVMNDLARRAGVSDSQGVILIPEILHEDLAEMIGCSRPMVTRLVTQMVESGLLARRGKQFVLLKKWDLSDNSRDSQKETRRLETVFPEKSPALAASSAGSANRLLAAVHRRPVWMSDKTSGLGLRGAVARR